MPHQPLTTKHTLYKKLAIYIISFIVIVGAIFIIVNYNRVKIFYAYTFEYEHFTYGDKIFGQPLSNKSPSEDQSYSLHLYRLIRPITIRDIDTLQSISQNKAILKKDLSLSLKPRLIETQDVVFLKAPDFYAGTFLKHEITSMDDGNKTTFWSVEAINFNKDNLFLHEREYNDPSLPKGYQWANNYYYLPTFYYPKNLYRNILYRCAIFR
jgi:hypothetical protein